MGNFSASVPVLQEWLIESDSFEQFKGEAQAIENDEGLLLGFETKSSNLDSLIKEGSGNSFWGVTAGGSEEQVNWANLTIKFVTAP